MNLPFVIPGHYEYIHSSSDSKQIIRVLGEGNKKNYFKLADGRELSETEILDNYIYLNTVSSENGPILGLPNFGEISDEIPKISTNEEVSKNTFVYEPLKKIQNEPEFEKSFELDKLELAQKNVGNNSILKPVKSEEDIFIDTILSKISKENDLAKYGEIQFKSSFEIPIKFEFIYDLNKLRQILHIFGTENINIRKFIERILKNDTDNIQEKIASAIMEFLLEEQKYEGIDKNIRQKDEATVNKYSNILNNF